MNESHENKKESVIDEIKFSSLLNAADLEAIKDNIANLDIGTTPEKFNFKKKNLSEEKSKESLLVKRIKRKKTRRAKKQLILPHKRTLADIIDDKSSGKPTLAEDKRRNLKSEVHSKKKKGSKNEYLEDSQKSFTMENLFSSIKPRRSRKKKTPTKWDADETKKFYKALELIGLDFTLMEQFFSKRTRKQLLRKFHKEKKKNSDEIEHALERHQNKNEKKTKRYRLFLDNYEKGSLKLSENESSFDSLDQTIHNKLKSLLDNMGDSQDLDEEEVQPINYYLTQIENEIQGDDLGVKQEEKEDDDETTADNVTLPASLIKKMDYNVPKKKLGNLLQAMHKSQKSTIHTNRKGETSQPKILKSNKKISLLFKQRNIDIEENGEDR